MGCEDTALSAWVTPSGETFVLPGGCQHSLIISGDEAARREYEKDTGDKHGCEGDTHAEAYLAGWVRVAYSGLVFGVQCPRRSLVPMVRVKLIGLIRQIADVEYVALTIVDSEQDHGYDPEAREAWDHLFEWPTERIDFIQAMIGD